MRDIDPKSFAAFTKHTPSTTVWCFESLFSCRLKLTSLSFFLTKELVKNCLKGLVPDLFKGYFNIRRCDIHSHNTRFPCCSASYCQDARLFQVLRLSRPGKLAAPICSTACSSSMFVFHARVGSNLI